MTKRRCYPARGIGARTPRSAKQRGHVDRGRVREQRLDRRAVGERLDLLVGPGEWLAMHDDGAVEQVDDPVLADVGRRVVAGLLRVAGL